MMNRRSLLSAILIAGIAPGIILTPGMLMPVRERRRSILVRPGDLLRVRFNVAAAVLEVSVNGKDWSVISSTVAVNSMVKFEPLKIYEKNSDNT